MAYNLKLTVFRISLKKKGGSNKELFPFRDFFQKAYDLSEKETAYDKFIKEYISSFESRFKLNRDQTKGIAADDIAKFSARSNKNIIDGEILGGQTGIPQSLFKQSNAKLNKGVVEVDDVATIPYYIKVWTPLDHDTGVLMVQSYSNLSVTELVRNHLAHLFHKHEYSLIFTPYVPDTVKEHFKDNSDVYKVAFVKEKLRQDKRKLIHPLFTDFDNLRVRIEVSGFKKSIDEFWDLMRGEEKFVGANLEDFDIKENDDFETIAYYRDSEGRKSHTTVKKNLDIQPTIFLPKSLKVQDGEYFEFEKIKGHTDDILNDIKKEIGYVHDS